METKTIKSVAQQFFWSQNQCRIHTICSHPSGSFLYLRRLELDKISTTTTTIKIKHAQRECSNCLATVKPQAIRSIYSYKYSQTIYIYIYHINRMQFIVLYHSYFYTICVILTNTIFFLCNKLYTNFSLTQCVYFFCLNCGNCKITEWSNPNSSQSKLSGKTHQHQCGH